MFEVEKCVTPYALCNCADGDTYFVCESIVVCHTRTTIAFT